MIGLLSSVRGHLFVRVTALNGVLSRLLSDSAQVHKYSSCLQCTELSFVTGSSFTPAVAPLQPSCTTVHVHECRVSPHFLRDTAVVAVAQRKLAPARADPVTVQSPSFGTISSDLSSIASRYCVHTDLWFFDVPLCALSLHAPLFGLRTFACFGGKPDIFRMETDRELVLARPTRTQAPHAHGTHIRACWESKGSEHPNRLPPRSRTLRAIISANFAPRPSWCGATMRADY